MRIEEFYFLPIRTLSESFSDNSQTIRNPAVELHRLQKSLLIV
jgi:hypothetical protein